MSKEERVAKAHQIIANITQNLTDLVDIFLSDKFTDETPVVENKKKRRDPNAPKLPTSNFFLFTNSIREEVERDFPDASFAEKSKIYGARWQKLSDEERKPFNEQALKEREKYQKEMAAYEEEHTDKKSKKESNPVASPSKAAAPVKSNKAAAKSTPPAATPAKATKATKAAPAAPAAKPAKGTKTAAPVKAAKPAATTTKATPVTAAPSKTSKKVVEESSSSDSDSDDSSSSDSDDSD